ncbi:MAG: hypothetical protein M3285_03915 [Actinomycetota bacterium]|nr:hypothetical protein [Actinomycetota bacterium]
MQTSGRSLLRRSAGEGALAAVLSFLGLLCVGAVLVAAARLQVPGLGAGATSLDVLAAVVVAAMGTLGGTVHLGNIELALVPMGALGLTLILFTRNLRGAVDRARPGSPLERRVMVGTFAIGFGLLCGTCAAIFEVDSGDGLSADPARAGVLGVVWALGVSLYVLRRDDSERPERRRLRDRGPAGAAVFVMAAVVAGLSAGGALMVAFTRLAGSAARMAGSLVHFVAIAPNAAVAVAALSVGSSVEVGASFTSAKAHLERTSSYSLLDWASGPTPPLAWALILVPIAGGVIAGWVAARRPGSLARAIGSVVVAAFGCGVLLGALCLAAAARLAAGALPQEGFGAIAPAPLPTALLAALWLGVFGTIGVGAAHLYSRRRNSEVASEPSSRGLSS